MSKAVLVIDMPESCVDCKLCRWEDRDLYCEITKEYIPDAPIPDWCPLCPMPEKKPEYLSINSKKGYCDGWNACIDAIGGGDGDRAGSN